MAGNLQRPAPLYPQFVFERARVVSPDLSNPSSCRHGAMSSKQERVYLFMTPSSRLGRLVISPLPVPAAWYALPLRAILGFGFLEHGYAKLARGPDHFSAILSAIGVPLPHVFSWATILVELIGGLLILAGALVPLVSIPMMIVLIVAIFTVHLPNGFSSIKLLAYDSAGAHFGQPGYETDLLYLAGLLALCLGGSGPLSIDQRLARRPR